MQGDKEIKVAVVGTGFGRYGHLPSLQNLPGVKVEYIIGSSPERTAEWAAKLGIPKWSTDPEEVFKSGDVTAVTVAVPSDQQFAVVKSALNQGLAVFAEKPLALSVIEATELAKVAEENSCPNMINFIFPELATFKRLKKGIDQGELGKVRHIYLDWRIQTHAEKNNLSNWKNNPQLGGFVFHFLSHLFYNLKCLMGDVQEVQYKKSSGGTSPDYDHFQAFLTFTNGVHGSVTATSIAAGGSGHNIEVVCENGTFYLTNSSKNPVDFKLYKKTNDDSSLLADDSEHYSQYTDKGLDPRVYPTTNMMSRWVEWIRGKEKHAPSFADGLWVQEQLEKTNP